MRNFSPTQKLLILRRADYKCLLCGVSLTYENFEADHKIAYSKGGAISTAFLVEEEGVSVEYVPDQFILKAQTDRLWFRQILLADSFSLPVLSMAVQILLGKRDATGQPHAMLVRSLNIPHTYRVARLLEDNFPILQGKVLVIHSEHEQYDLAGRASALLEKFYTGEYWVVVHCGMLLVGFDHKWVSVSCNLCILKSLSLLRARVGQTITKSTRFTTLAFSQHQSSQLGSGSDAPSIGTARAIRKIPKWSQI